MKKTVITAVAVCALALAGVASAALEPGVYDPGNTGCVTSTYSDGALHLAKNCATSTNASAGATITGVTGQTFQSASFTLASTTQCQGGSPRFNVVAGGVTYFLGCNNVTPTVNPDGTATYTFTPQSLTAAAMPVPSGSISLVQVLIDVQGTADLSHITFNGVLQKPMNERTAALAKCKHGGWKSFTSPTFKNQGRCVSHFVHELNTLEHTGTKHHHS